VATIKTWHLRSLNAKRKQGRKLFQELSTLLLICITTGGQLMQNNSNAKSSLKNISALLLCCVEGPPIIYSHYELLLGGCSKQV